MSRLADYRPLPLLVEDAEDLKILSAMLQDAVAKIGDFAHLPRERRFAFVANRFVWECAADRKRGPFASVRAGCHFDDVLSVRQTNLRAVRGYLPSWLTVTAIARDVMILLGVLVFHLNRMEIKIRPSAVSKINTCFQFITLSMVLLKGCILFPSVIYDALYYATAALTIGSGLHYMLYGLKAMGEGTGNSVGRGERRE